MKKIFDVQFGYLQVHRNVIKMSKYIRVKTSRVGTFIASSLFLVYDDAIKPAYCSF